MQVSLKWLKELVDPGMTAAELVDRLDMTGTAVESVHAVGSDFDGVVVGRIVEKERHPEADKLWVTKVDVGGSEPLQIVCGAQNFEAGDKVPVALVGATLPNGMTIKKAKLRGVVSEGMNCSATELGVGADASGLLILPAHAPVGMSFAEYGGLADTIIDLEVTPNRPDCLSMAGVAREVGAVTGKPWSLPASVPTETGAPASDTVSVRIDDADLCPRYTARLVRGVKVGPSPAWLAERVAAAGARPISNVVDITNYVMFELGQPLHAFDAATLTDAAGAAPGRGAAVIVRQAAEGERLTTLDGVERALTPETLVIADPSGPVALAGVMGGADTEVSDETVDVLLESACFQPASTSRTSRALGLVSEASLRFERGVDPNGCAAAVDRAAQLLAEVCGGEVAPGIVDVYPRMAEPAQLDLRLPRLDALLGTALPGPEVSRILASLGLTVEQASPETLWVTVPTFRPDLTREIDLVEEVVRVWGMERVPSTLPRGGMAGTLSREQNVRARIEGALRAAGLNETMTYAFSDPADLLRLGWTPGEGECLCEVLNPMSTEQSVLRPTIAAGLIRSAGYNQRRGVPDVHLYEAGAVFVTADGRKQPKERQVVAGLLAGRWDRPLWNDAPAGPNSPDHLDFFDGKGVLETLMEELGVARWSVRPGERPWLQPGRSADVIVGGDVAGWLGEVHPAVLEAFEASGPVVLFELQMKPLLRAAVTVKRYADVPRFPGVSLDIALVVPEEVETGRVVQAVKSAGGKLLEAARLFDVYRGPGVPEGHKSLAFSLTYRASDRTLTDDEVRGVHDKLVRKVSEAVGGTLRA